MGVKCLFPKFRSPRGYSTMKFFRPLVSVEKDPHPVRGTAAMSEKR